MAAARIDKQALRRLRRNTAVLCCIGIMVSAYAYHVETNVEMKKDYRAMCDINKYISCSKAFSSRFGKGFGIMEHLFGKDSIINQPNSVYGITFYITHLILGEFNHPKLSQGQVILSAVANCGSVYLAYILAFILKDFCIVCASMYIVNFFVLMYNIKRKNILMKSTSAGNSKKNN